MKSTLLIGSVGGPNFGDEAIMRVWIESYLEKSQNNVVFFDGYARENLNKISKNMFYPNAYLSSESQSIFNSTKSLHFSDGKNMASNLNDYCNKIKKISDSIKELNVEQIHIFGGGYINSIWPDNYLLLVSSVLAAAEANIPLIASGQGLTPSNQNYMKFLQFFKYFSFCDVRDKESFGIISDIIKTDKGSFTGDDAILSFLMKKNPLVKEESTPSVVFCVQNDLFDGNLFAKKILSDEIFSFFSGKGFKNFKFISAMHNDYFPEDENIKKMATKHNISITHINEMQLIKYGIPVHKDSFFITSRYHVHLLASLWGCKGISLYKNEYYKIKHDAVNMMGSLWKCMNYDEALNVFSDWRSVEELINKSKSYNKEIKEFFLNKKNDFRKKILNENIKEKSVKWSIDISGEFVNIF